MLATLLFAIITGVVKAQVDNQTAATPVAQATDPNIESCMDKDNICVCRLTGNWHMSQEYEELKRLSIQTDAITDKLNAIDIDYIKHSVNVLHERMRLLHEKVYTQTVSISVKGLLDVQKSVKIMTHLIGQLDLNATSSNVIDDLEAELRSLSDVIKDLWETHPTLDATQLDKQIKELQSRLSNCRGSYNISFFRGDTLPVNQAYDGWCEDYELVGVGEAIVHRFVSHPHWTKGQFMKDPYPQTEANRTMIYVRNFIAEGSYSSAYLRYNNYTDFIGAKNQKSVLTRVTRGDGYALYKGSLFDHTRDNKINRYTIISGSFTSLSFVPSSVKYLKQDSDTYVDFKADETGLYVIYTNAAANGEFLIIGKLDPNDLSEVQTWHTSRHKRSVCAAFMTCGILYTIDNCWSRLPPANSNRQYTYNTVYDKEGYVKFHIPSKFGMIRQLSYNSRERVLFGWDNGHFVTYILKWQRKDTSGLGMAA